MVPDPVDLAKIASGVWEKRVRAENLRVLDETVKDVKVLKAVLDMSTKDGVPYGLKG